MVQIVTLTFNPCIDKSFATETIVPDRKLACTSPRVDPGGGGINVARAIGKLGGAALAIYPAGGPQGQLLTDLLREEQVPVRPVRIAGDTRENINVTESSCGRQYRFVVKGPALTEKVWKECLEGLDEVLKGGYIVVSGSLPEPWPEDIFVKIRKMADDRRAHLIVDTSGKGLEAALRAGVYLVKPSIRELESLALAMGLAGGEPCRTADYIVGGGLAEVVVISAGPGGAMLVTKEGVREFRAPEVCKVSTVGAGDSMVAGIVLNLSRGASMEEAVRYGVACGSAAVMNPGTALCRREDVDALCARVDCVVPVMLKQ